ncbi:MAG: DJ-1/PfpI family protein [Pseudomonadota bacterium]
MKSLAVFIFPEIQTLDLFGPIEMLGGLRDRISLTLVAESLEPVVTRHGQHVLPDKTIHDETQYDLLLIPGGDSAILAGKRPAATEWIVRTCKEAELVMTVCTGSILLAMTGMLDGRRATTNKIDFVDTIPLGPNVDWVAKARWIQDGKYFTSSGVSAGMDMSLAAISYLYGREAAEKQAIGTEYNWNQNPDWDPFAERCGLA